MNELLALAAFVVAVPALAVLGNVVRDFHRAGMTRVSKSGKVE